MVPSTPQSSVTVAVKVTVNEKGKVLDAHKADDSPSSDAFLVKQALNAAMRWSFSPATRGGVPVASDFRIDFVFTYNK
jgi:TonB family protein